MSVKKYTKKDFAWTKWNAKDITKAADDAITEKKRIYADIKKIPAKERTFENTIYAIEASDHTLSDVMGFISIHAETNPSAGIRAVAHKMEVRIANALVDIEYDEKIYQAVEEYAAKKEKLSGADKKLLKDTQIGYKQMGLALPAEKRRTLQQNIKRLTKLSQKFLKNVNDYEDYILVTKAELKGLPESYIARLSKDKKTGKRKVTLDHPDFFPFIKKAEDAQKRKELMDKNLQKGGKKNIALLQDMLTVRRANAKLLGYRTYADYKTELRTVKTAKKAVTFVDTLISKVKQGAREEVKELERMKQEMTGSKEARLTYYDIAFYSDQLQQEKFRIDSEHVREYFPLEVVKKGIFDIYSTLFSISFKKINVPTWHPDVDMYEIKDKGKTIAYFALDLYPRSGKYGHACVHDTVHGRAVDLKSNTRIAPFGVMLTNFPKPHKKHPSLLSHGEVETFFHEFGHLIHHTLSQTKYMSQAGITVAWDFVEAPSQMLEYWVWDKKMLRKLSAHYQTGKRFPDDLFKKLHRTRFFMVSFSTIRQLMFAKFDLELHTRRISDICGLYRKLYREHTAGVSQPKDSRWPAGFGHIAGGYDAGYYGYMWSKVFAADMFTRFARKGVLDKKTGREYREKVLAKGSSEDEMKLVKDFLGRKPSQKAFLKELKIKK